MKLKTELAACECSMPEEDFKYLLVSTLEKSYPYRTIDDLVCGPLTAIKYCNEVRDALNSPLLHDGIILKALMNIRKRKDCPTGLKGGRSGKKQLKTQLQEVGFENGASAFNELVCDCFASMYKSRTIDDITCYPIQSRAYCTYVRNKSGVESLTDDLILRSLMNTRKAA